MWNENDAIFKGLKWDANQKQRLEKKGKNKMDAEGMAGMGAGLAVMGIGLSIMSKVMKTTAKTTKKGGGMLFNGFKKASKGGNLFFK